MSSGSAPTGLGWPAATSATDADVSRETSVPAQDTGLGWPTTDPSDADVSRETTTDGAQ